MICTACSKILDGSRRLLHQNHESLLFVHHARIAQMQAAAESGCRFCTPFWEYMPSDVQKRLLDSDLSFAGHEQDMPDIDDDSAEARSIRASATDNGSTTCIVFPHTDWLGTEFNDNLIFVLTVSKYRLESTATVDALRSLTAMFVLLPSRPSELNDTAVSRSDTALSAQTDSLESWACVKAWMKGCLATHVRCNQHRPASWYPTRLLKFPGQEGTFRIIETNGMVCTGPYMTLSHRWGPTQPRKLDKTTRAALYGGVPIADLPQAFQDAIAICKRLSIRYLWIDCLCIMQDRDDLSDWTREASLMHMVYANSYLNISALRCPDSSHSLFATRNPALMGEARVKTRLAGLHFGDSEREHDIVPLSFWRSEVGNEPLNLRCWVLQERLLAPRILNFGRRQLLWECNELEASESYPLGLPPVMSENSGAWSKKADPASFAGHSRSARLQGSPEHAPYAYWASIVQAYTRCGLTVPSDKLIAVAGVAKDMMARYIDDSYVAGMWRRHLAAELTWSVTDQLQGSGQPSRRASPYRAPTFSWASVEGVIEPGKPAGDLALIEVVDVALDPVNEDPTGQLRGGSLTMRCQLQRISFRAGTPLASHHVVTVNGQEAMEPLERPEWERHKPRIILDEAEEYFNPLTQDPDTLFCVPARLTPDKTIFESLLLRLVSAPAGTYERFGLLSSYLGERSDVRHDASHVRAALQGRSPDEALFPCLLTHTSGKPHTIRVI